MPQTQSPSTAPGAAKSPSQPANSGAVNDDIYQQDGDYIRDIEINDLRNRYTLTKGSTQKMVNTLVACIPTDTPRALSLSTSYLSPAALSMGLLHVVRGETLLTPSFARTAGTARD